MKMTKRERVLAALNHEQIKQFPYHIDFTEQAKEKLIECTQNPNIISALGTCLHYNQYWGWPTEIVGKEGFFKDEFGVVWNRTGADKDIGIVDKPQISDLENCSYKFPSFDEKRLRDEYKALVESKEDRFTMAGFGFCMFERAWSLMGMEQVLISMIECPERLEEFLDDICNYYLQLLDIALEYDVDGVYFGDDWGQQKGLIMGAAHWRRFIKPRMARLYARAKEKGKYVFQHSCGDCNEILADLIEIGLNCYQTFQPEIYDIKKVKQLYKDKLTFWGGISTQQCLPQCTQEQVKEIVKNTIDIMNIDGGYIAAPSHAIEFDVPCENIFAMLEVFANKQ